MAKITYRKGDDPHFRLWRLMAYMLWPLEENKRRLDDCATALLEAETAVFNRQLQKSHHALPLKSPYHPSEPFLTSSFQEAWFPELMPDKSRQAPGSYISVALMTYFYIGLHAAKQSGKDIDCSEGKAAALAGYNTVTRTNGTTLVQKSGKQIMSEWNKLNRVAHFWTAYLLMMPMPDRGDPLFHGLDRFLKLSNYVAERLAVVTSEPIDLWKMNDKIIRDHVSFEICENTLALLQSNYEVDRSKGSRIKSETSSK
ncbi:MAG: hypothetical protein EPO08_16495 [Rhodospirillaceae bacterium]|nr:MAG: hypothetical protein EPO08_16495 [Rhodospirillaceae bacterium]